jgi:serine/threonine protein phosphatase PrpC
VIAEPEIIDFTITPEDKFIVIASDGVWEYLSNEDVMNIVLPFVERENSDMAAERVVTESTNAWRKVIN